MDPILKKAAEEGDVMYLAGRIVRRNRTEEVGNEYGRSEHQYLLNTTQEDKDNILHLAASAGRDLFVALAVQFLPVLSNQVNSHGETPLLVAAKSGHFNVVGTIKKPKIKFDLRRDMATATTTLIGTYSSSSCHQGEVEEGLVDLPLELGTIHDDTAVAGSRHQRDGEERDRVRRMSPGLYRAAKEADVRYLSYFDGRSLTEEEAMNSYIDKYFLRFTEHSHNNILHVAARAGRDTFVAKALRRFPFLSDQVNSQGDTPLLVAARFGHLEVVKLLAEPNKESQVQDDMAATTAAANGANSRGTGRSQRNDEERLSDLEQGTIQENVATVENEANPRDTSLDDGTSLSRSRGQTEVEEEQVDHQLDVRERPVDHQPEMPMPQPWRVKNSKQDTTTTLHEALRNGHESVARYLFEKDPNMATLVNGTGESPLFLAAESNCQLFMTDVLLSNQPYSTEGPYGQNALHAAQHCDGTIIDELVRQKPDLMWKLDNHGKAAIHYAVEAEYWVLAGHILKANPSIALFSDADGYTPFLRAASRGLGGVCYYILQRRPEAIEARNDKGQHALHLARLSNYRYGSKFLKIPEIRELLNVSDDEGNTPLHLAIKENCYVKVMLLTSCGNINLGAVNKEGHTALDLCEPDWKHFTLKRLMWDLLRKLKAPRGRRPNEHNVPIGHWPSAIYDDADLRPFNNTILLVATLLATLTFAAAIAIPGGFKNEGPEEGTAVLTKKAALHVFIVSDTLAMSCSLAVVFLLSRAILREQDAAQIFGFISWHLLKITLIATLVAFMSGVFAIISSEALWLAILVCIICPLGPLAISKHYGSAAFPWEWPTILNVDFQRGRQSRKRMKIGKWNQRSARLTMQRSLRM